MHLLILDFMARRWWEFLVIFAFAALGASVGSLYVFTPWLVLSMMRDQQLGWFRAVNGLPLSRRTRATVCWSVGVLLPALVVTLGLLVGALIFYLTSGPQQVLLPDAPTYTLVLNPKYFAPLFAVAVGASFGVGYAALCFLIAFVIPTRLPAKFAPACLPMFIPLASFAPMFASFILPTNPGMMETWHWVTFGSIPILVLLSWIAAPCMLGDRTLGSQSTGNGKWIGSSFGCSKGLTGMKLFVTHTVIVYVLGVSIGVFAVAGLLMLYRSESLLDGVSPSSFVTVSMIGCFQSQRLYDLRVLRSLPLSTSRLVLLLMLGPIICGFVNAVGVTALCRSEFPLMPPTLLFFTLFFSLSGGCALAVACWGQFATWKCVLVALASIVLIALGVAGYHPLITPLVLPTGAVILLLSSHLFKRGLRKPESYQKLRGITASEAAPFSH